MNKCEIFNALRNEDRQRMVCLLEEKKKMYAKEFEYLFYLEQSTISNHLNVLYNSGICKKEKVGRKTYYSLNVNTVFNLYKDFKMMFMKLYSKPSI